MNMPENLIRESLDSLRHARNVLAAESPAWWKETKLQRYTDTINRLLIHLGEEPEAPYTVNEQIADAAGKLLAIADPKFDLIERAQLAGLGATEEMLDGDTTYSTQEAAMGILNGTVPVVSLTVAECKAIHDMVSMIGGSNPEQVFAKYTTGEDDDPNDPYARAFAKVYQAAGRQVPDNLRNLK